jgi:hypothetical protein
VVISAVILYQKTCIFASHFDRIKRQISLLKNTVMSRAIPISSSKKVLENQGLLCQGAKLLHPVHALREQDIS